MMTIKLGTRRSKLAVTQSQLVADMITQKTGLPVQLVTISAEGDDTTVPLDGYRRPGAFVATLRDALLRGEVDVAVHSFKDLPSAPHPGLQIAAVPSRIEPRDVLCSREGQRLDQLASGAKVGTSSPRRTKGLLRVRPDLQIEAIRGNVDSRLNKMFDAQVDAIVLAGAGLIRIGRENEITQYLDDFLPAPAQGALALECRAGDERFTGLNDYRSALQVAAERELLAVIGAQCTTAIGALATWQPAASNQLRLRAELADFAGISYRQVSETSEVTDLAQARNLGRKVGAALIAPDSPTKS